MLLYFREEKEKWIRAKYDAKEFLPPPPYVDIPLNQQLIDALVREDIRNIVLILGHASAADITAPYSKDDGRTALHIAAALGNVVFVQLLLWVSKWLKFGQLIKSKTVKICSTFTVVFDLLLNKSIFFVLSTFILRHGYLKLHQNCFRLWKLHMLHRQN